MSESFEGQVEIAKDGGSKPTVRIDGENGNINLGGDGVDGDMTMTRNDGTRSVHLDGNQANLWMGGNGADGDVSLFPHSADDLNDLRQATIKLDASNGEVELGGNGVSGKLFMQRSSGNRIFSLNANESNFRLGGSGTDGDIMLYKGEGITTDLTVHLDASTANLRLGGNGTEGDVILFREDVDGEDDSQATIRLDANFGNLLLGGNGVDGDVLVFPQGGNPTDSGTATIHIDGDAGDIVLRNADLAEDFAVASAAIAPGSLLVINDQGVLETAKCSYDRRVAGIVSGAGDYRPGLVLDRHSGERDRLPIALSGKVICLADATQGPIAIGDLLTTADSPGHAMAVRDHDRALGAIVGKALAPLESGCGEIPVLVALQ